MPVAPGALHVVVELPHKSGLVEDTVINTWNFAQAASDGATADTITANLNDFYNADVSGTGTGSLSTYFANSFSRTVPPLVKFYQIVSGGGPLGSPIFTRNLSLLSAATPGGQSLPAEVALCMSFHGDYSGAQEELGNTRPRARRRGRIYFGPWLQGVTQEGTNGVTHPTTNIINVIMDAAKVLMNHPILNWVVWSRVESTLWPIVNVSVDNAFDSQRRRGEIPTSKTIIVPALGLTKPGPLVLPPAD